ncbi:hypothetical protein ACJQWK_04477 [Exserohilum turcicum]
MHLKYGPTIRIAPDELIFVDAKAWKDIYGHRSGTPEYIKDPSLVFTADAGPSLFSVHKGDHSKLRRLLSHGFSDKALREQETVISGYANLLVDRLRQFCDNPVDVAAWYNYLAFDVIGHLLFAESFNCLSRSDYHPWVKFIFSTMRVISWNRSFNRLAPRISQFLIKLVPQKVVDEGNALLEMTRAKLHRRIEAKLQYTDLMENLLVAQKQGKITMDEVFNNATPLIVAGSETTATALSGATYFLNQNPEVYQKLKTEVRSAFTHRSEITISKAAGLRYLAAVIDETMRLYPPSPTSHPRLVTPEGGIIAGYFVPGNTLVGISQYSAFRSPHNFAWPDEFAPERFVDSNQLAWAGDKRDVLQPFLFGPRNCIGRNLALIEMRLVLALVVFEFDIEVLPESRNWIRQKLFTTWERPSLMVRMTPVAR